MNSHIKNLLSQGQRLDGRKFDEYRKVEVETGILPAAEGSARVKIGATEVLVGVKLEVMTPYPDNPNSGSIMINAELLPLSSPKFESGPPSIVAIELARVVDRGIRESGAVDFDALCITPGEKVWMVVVDVCPVNADGNLFDAAALGAMAALTNAVFPEYKDGKLNYEVKTDVKLPIKCKTTACTVIKIGEHLLVDPTPEEEEAAESRLTVASLDENTLCAMQKGGAGALTLETVNKIVELASKKATELRAFI